MEDRRVKHIVHVAGLLLGIMDALRRLVTRSQRLSDRAKANIRDVFESREEKAFDTKSTSSVKSSAPSLSSTTSSENEEKKELTTGLY